MRVYLKTSIQGHMPVCNLQSNTVTVMFGEISKYEVCVKQRSEMYMNNGLVIISYLFAL
jgi:hypothetical protein